MKQITPEKDQDRVSIIVITFALIIFIYLQFTKEDRQKAEKKQRLKGLFEDASERAEELAAIFELFAGKFESMVASRVASRARTSRVAVCT